MEPIVLLLALSALAVAALRWGVDSTEEVNSPEWERRRRWRGVSGVRSWPDGESR
jgi:hypothetical protein